ncbi:hypothetical protein HPB50_019531 [Hyalomma asiaticum]|uniref:Uncharacterized protein n=1 Tax=Hyalomma asiaticum TaxID=266040 RepID=A0ACB7S4I3_HYAAI|nr:hypothetical protein HPB50_019531 [Hyalomma asiaticum]
MSSGQRRRHRLGFAIVGVTVVLFVTVLAYYSTLAIAVPSRPLETSKHPNLCETADCIAHSRLLTKASGKIVDPCEDFEDHVCSARHQLEHGHGELVTAAAGNVLAAWYENFENMLLNATALVGASRKPLAMLRTCSRQHTASSSDVALFRSFMSKLRLSWPEEPPDDVNPLAVILDLTFNWGLCFWLRIRLSRKPGSRLGSRIRVMLSPGRTASVYDFAMRYYRLVSDGAYARYWTRLRNILSNGEAPGDSDRIQRSKLVEGKAIKLLVSIVNKHTVDPVSVSFSNISLFTRPVSSAEWLEQINSVLRYERPFRGDDEVLASDETLLHAIGEMFATFSSGELLSYLSWQFVQTCAPYLDLSLGDFACNRDIRMFCADQVLSSYSPLITAIYTRLNPPQKSHRYMATRVSAVLKHVLRKVLRSTNLDNLTRTATAVKITSMNVRLWPVGELLRNPDNIYAEFPENGTSFVGLWIDTRQSLRSMIGTPHRDVAFSFGNIDPSHLVHYDYLTNELEISVAALTSPLYYSNGTNAMFYGGLGFLVAKEVLKMQDAIGARYYPNGSVVPLWLYKRSRKLVEEQDACLEARRKLRTYLPALEVSYSAFQEATRHEKRKLQLSEELTEPKTFFKTVCLTTCLTRGLERGNPLVKCNHLVENSFEFVAAFGCNKLSRMNSPRKCPYFKR